MSIPLCLQFIVAVMSLYIFIRALTMRSVPKASYFLLLSLSIFFYSLGYLLQLDAKSLTGAYMAVRIQMLGISTFAPLYYLFVRDFNDRRITNRWVILALFIIPAVVLATSNAYPEIKWFYSHIEFTGGSGMNMKLESGPLLNVHMFYCLACIVMSAFEIVHRYPTSSDRERTKKMLFMFATIVPTTSIMVLGIERFRMPMEIGSASLVFSLFILGHYILTYRVQDWLPFAREIIVEHLSDGYVLLDQHNAYIDANAIAKQYIPSLNSASGGQNIYEIEGFPIEVLDGQAEFPFDANGREIYVRTSATPIVHNGMSVCTAVMFYDITEEHNLMNELVIRASHDSLTGLLNRGAFFDPALRDFHLHQRTKTQAVVMMMDLDNFKEVNDTYGHLAGDDVLRRLGSIMQKRLRHTDISSRYGGEEFIVFLPATDGPGALQIAQDIRQSLEHETFSSDAGTFHATVSIGLASLVLDDTSTLESLIAQADSALYQAKQQGRNRVVEYC